MSEITKSGFNLPSSEEFVVNDPKEAKVFTVPFTPLEERVRKEQPEMFRSLQKLKEIVGEEAFVKHFSDIQSLRRNETTVMMTTSSGLQRTNIESYYIAAIEKAFDVQYVRIVSL